MGVTKPWFRYGMPGLALTLSLMMFSIPSVRHATLNLLGVKASASIVVVDEQTQLPLKNVIVNLDGNIKKTGKDGQVSFEEVKLGSQELSFSKLAFDTKSQEVVVSMGDNVLDEANLKPIGKQYKFNVRDWLSGDALEGAEVSLGESSALVSSKGLATLTIPSVSEDAIEVVVAAEGYLDQPVVVGTSFTGETAANMVVDTLHYFISNNNVYESSADGSNRQVIVEDVVDDDEATLFDVAPSNKKAVLVSTRDNDVDSDGALLSGLFAVDLPSRELVKVDESQRIDLVGWINDFIIYIKFRAELDDNSPQRHQLISYNTVTDESNELAESNYFNDVLVAGDYVFYAPSGQHQQNGSSQLLRATPEGSKNTVFNESTWAVIRNSFNTVQFDVAQTWYSTSIDRIFATALDKSPVDRTSRLYEISPNGKKAFWIEQQGDQGVLKTYDIESGEEQVIYQQRGLRYPAKWLSDNHVQVRIADSSGSTDYVLPLGLQVSPQKISNVSGVYGADKWYYFY